MASEIRSCSVAVRRLSEERVVPHPLSASIAQEAASAVRTRQYERERIMRFRSADEQRKSTYLRTLEWRGWGAACGRLDPGGIIAAQPLGPRPEPMALLSLGA